MNARVECAESLRKIAEEVNRALDSHFVPTDQSLAKLIFFAMAAADMLAPNVLPEARENIVPFRR